MKLEFSAFAGTLKEQLKNQGFYSKNIERYEKLRNSITMLSLHSYVNDTQHQKMVNKLFKDIEKDSFPIDKNK